jgi:hypothetical protein
MNNPIVVSVVVVAAVVDVNALSSLLQISALIKCQHFLPINTNLAKKTRSSLFFIMNHSISPKHRNLPLT